ncbi:putative reverse transcriptase domain-containing protein [Tanacetum coccineum]|uniref:Reverse transcriptase domain-containing protein n=1 Tax=Tanacetum coccineum TaxID=301880 RepID=A0ABQ5ANM0_9ASTR
MTTAPSEGNAPPGLPPLCNRCFVHHIGPYMIQYHKCGKVGHKARHCKEKNVDTGANAQPVRGLVMMWRARTLQGTTAQKEQATSYEAELADEKVVSTNTMLRGCTLNLVNYLFEIDLMPIELDTFDVIVGMAWLAERDAIIVCVKKVVRIPCGNKTLIVEGDKVTEKKAKEKRLKDVLVIRNFPEVFPDDFPGLPTPRQVEFKINLVPGAAPVARAPYRLAPSKMKELSGTVGERIYSPEFIIVGSSGVVCKEEGWILSNVFGACTPKLIRDADTTSFALKEEDILSLLI